MNFTKLDDTDFPNIDTVDVFAFKNDYDYKRFDNAQMTIHICNVPWDMGEAHVGQRTITGIGNVVKFENDNARDKWFASKRYAETPEQWAQGGFDGFKWVTKYREFFNGEEIKIPLPFDVVAKFNYCWITYEPTASAEFPVNYEHGGILSWFWFIRNFQMLSVNATAATIKRDTWQTYINHIQFKGLYLEQGHYPIANSSVENYLANPIENNSGLLEPDVTFGELAKVTHSAALVLNENNIKAVIVSSGNPTAAWGTKSAGTWNTPNGYKTQDGQPSFYAFAIEPNQLNAFISACNASTPQFIQTIKCVFFISSDLITISNEFTFNGIACNWIASKNSTLDLIDLSKSQFGYNSKYAHLAKLYTFPYAALELTDEKGNVTLVKIEETSGNLSLQTSLNLAYPWLNIDGRIAGIGGNVSKTLTFRNVSSHSFIFSGRWYEYLTQWQIPTFAITQNASVHNDYATHFDRAQQALAAANDNTNSLNANATANTNTLASANAQYNNIEADILTERTNAGDEMSLRTSITELQNALNDAERETNKEKINNDMNNDNQLLEITTAVENDVAAASTFVNSAGNAVQGFTSGAIQGAVTGGAAGAAGGAMVGAGLSLIGAATSAASTSLVINSNVDITGAAIDNNALKASNAANNIDTITDLRMEFNSNQNSENNRIVAGIVRRTQDKNQSNNTRTKDTGVANANREKATADGIANLNLATANSAITNQINQAALETPYEFGEFANGDTANTRPIAMVANVITQNKDAIEKTGDYFLRYGYAYNKYIDFQDFNLMPKFTYWKCSDVWVYGLDMSDEHMDEIRFFLMGGVTVWRKPEYIGTTSIYENV